MKRLLSIALLALFETVAPARTEPQPVVIGPGSAAVSKVVAVCKWETNPACNFYVSIRNTSKKAEVQRIEFKIDGLKPVEVKIAQGKTEIVPVPMLKGLTAEAMIKSMRIVTQKTEK